MKSIDGGGKGRKKQDPRGLIAQRRGLLAKIHIAKEQLGLSDLDYRGILVNGFRVTTAAALSIGEMEKLVAHFIACGWRDPSRRIAPMDVKTKESQILSLQDRAKKIASVLENGPWRLRGMCRAICGADDPAWCRDVNKLKRLVAVLEKVKRTEQGGSHAG